MGTNYYAIPRSCPAPCDHCDLPDVHIGKSLTMFRAYERGAFGDDDPILSWRDWRDALGLHASCVRDEYGGEMSVGEFVAAVQATTRKQRERQYRWMVEHALDSGAADYLDIDGFSFSRREFC